MALDTTVGTLTSESYASVATATTYHSARANAAWAAGTLANQEAALRRATEWLDGKYRSRWPGIKAGARLQALEWPRYDVIDTEGSGISGSIIPTEVVRATCEAALRELVAPGSLSPDVTLATMVKREQVGPLSVEYVGAGGVSGAQPTITIIDGILSGIIGASSASGTSFLDRA